MKRSTHYSFTIFNPLLVLLILCILCCTKGCVERERAALLDFKKSFTSAYIENSAIKSWHFDKHAVNCCSWNGITCDSHTGHVVSLDLCGQGLTASELRPSLVQLQHLRSLNMSGNFFAMRIPSFFGSLNKLTSLILSNAGFFGVIPPQLGNISHIQNLDLSSNEFYWGEENKLSIDNLEWLSHLSSLESLSMSQVNFGEARDWLSVIKNLPVLSSFICESCNFSSPDLAYIAAHRLNSSSSLQTLDLSLSYLDSIAPFPDIFHNMISLKVLRLPNHLYEDGIFNSIGKLCNLEELHASGSVKNPTFANIVQALSGCASTSLDRLDLNSMHLIGAIPPMLSNFKSLTYLDLSFNWLDSFPKNLPIFPAYLTDLCLNDNKLIGVLSDLHFTNITKIDYLYLNNNPNLSVRFNKPLAATTVSLRSCNLGPNFPSWILAQNSLQQLDISHCMISDTIPFMFWRNIYPSLSYLNFSFNNLYHVVPNIHIELPSIIRTIDLRSNALSGRIPFFLFIIKRLYLLDNMFTGFAPIPARYNLSTSDGWWVYSRSAVDLSNNLLTGTIPDWLGFQTPELSALVLANNNLSGPIPSSIGYSFRFFVLNLSNNSFSGLLPSWLKNCSELRVLDLSENRLSGFIPHWIGEDMTRLSVVSLRSNSLTGALPTSLCHLTSLQVLDTSHNLLSGNILPCIYNFTTMATDVNFTTDLPVYYTDVEPGALEDVTSYFNAYIKWKSKVSQYHSLLPLVKLIDLSSNNLSGEIPNGLASLVKLVSVDFSYNSLQGSIPKQIGQLKSLQYLNLSHNRINGQIPPTLADISSLGVLDFSDNNLSGRIPKGTQLQSFDPSAYAGNLGLCGSPLGKCPGDRDDSVQPSPIADSEMEDKRAENQCFYGGLGTGFAFGFLGILASLNWITKWRFAFFQSAT